MATDRPRPHLILPGTLLALTISQPWPRMFLLDEDPKRVENRMWQPPRELIGQYFALHGGRRPKSEKDFGDIRDALDWVNLTQWAGEEDPEEWSDDEGVLRSCLSGIFAVARLEAVTTRKDLPWRTGDRFGWVLGDVVPLAAPVACAGQKNLWEVAGDLRGRVERELGITTSTSTPAPAPAAAPLAPVRAAPLPPVATFRPGRPVRDVPLEPESRRLYGLAVGEDWVTFLAERTQHGERWKWCSRLSDGGHSGSRTEFIAWVGKLRGARAA